MDLSQQTQYYEPGSQSQYNFPDRALQINMNSAHLSQDSTFGTANVGGGPTYGPLDPSIHHCGCGDACTCGIDCCCDDQLNCFSVPEPGQAKWKELAQHVQQQVHSQFEAQIQQRVDETVAAELAQLQAKIAHLEQYQAEKAADTKAAHSSTKMPKEYFEGESHLCLQDLIKVAMLGLLGMPDAKSPVPGPLEDDAVPRVNEQGDTLHNPVWAGQKANGAQPLVIAVVNLVWRNENDSRTLPEEFGPLNDEIKAMLKKAAIQHWRTKQRRWLAENTERGAAQLVHKLGWNGRYQRLKRLADIRRSVIAQMIEEYGAENCVGLPALIHSPWCSDDDGEGPGQANPEQWQDRRLATGDPRARERLRPEWRSKKQDRIFGLLDTLARKAETKAADSHVPIGGRHSGKKRSKDRRRSQYRVIRFPGFPENSSKASPAKRTPYQWSVNPRWRQENNYECVPDPAEFTIFNLVIPDEHLDREALALLAGVAEDDACLADDEAEKD
ncbi:hypothetical protein B0H16DRAFT_1453391 [Mycena metata]|uniref:Uncharacterized protein n=1 Tax=Mycena metata TaxID=1033252 RepID=A0AAD7JQ26_9AGAR|nr:hypothetical protein B0H16DRAFT_1453391 [Mycena metata]